MEGTEDGGDDAVPGGEGLRPRQDDAVHHDERDEDAQRPIQRRRVALHQELNHRDEGRDDHDEDEV